MLGWQECRKGSHRLCCRKGSHRLSLTGCLSQVGVDWRMRWLRTNMLKEEFKEMMKIWYLDSHFTSRQLSTMCGSSGRGGHFSLSFVFDSLDWTLVVAKGWPNNSEEHKMFMWMWQEISQRCCNGSGREDLRLAQNPTFGPKWALLEDRLALFYDKIGTF